MKNVLKLGTNFEIHEDNWVGIAKRGARFLGLVIAQNFGKVYSIKI